jgi:hypothetical protein
MPPVKFTLNAANPVYSMIDQQNAGTIISSGESSKMILKLLNRVAPPIVTVRFSASRGAAKPLVIYEDKIGEEVKVIPRTNLEFSIDPVLSTGQYNFEVIFL